MNQTADATATGARALRIPFDAARLDRLLEESKIDVVLVCSRHNIQYLLGGYRFFFFDRHDGIQTSRYLPLLIYQKGHPERTTYVAYSAERFEIDNGMIWAPRAEGTTRGTIDAMQRAVEHLKSFGKIGTIGVERAWLPADAEQVLRESMPDVRIAEAWSPLERLRAVKTPEELRLIREASERVADSMMHVMKYAGPGKTKHELVRALRDEQHRRGLIFEYCLIAVGGSLNRAPSDAVWKEGEILSLDSGGNYRGYIGDLCRMAFRGEPDSELVDTLLEIEEIQQAARKPLRPGVTGRELYTVCEQMVRRSPNSQHLDFMVHGLGLLTHESPRLSYGREDIDVPLEANMVVSIETTLLHPRRGVIKLEDTVAITEDGWEAYGDIGRSWTRGGTGAHG
jgi:Xaa-Pro aminopeptidase